MFDTTAIRDAMVAGFVQSQDPMQATVSTLFSEQVRTAQLSTHKQKRELRKSLLAELQDAMDNGADPAIIKFIKEDLEILQKI